MAIEDGGPAFPMPESIEVRHYDKEGDMTGSTESIACGENAAWHGMSLRDYFAAKALTGLMSDPVMRPDSTSEFENMAMRLYQVADAMLKARGES